MEFSERLRAERERLAVLAGGGLAAPAAGAVYWLGLFVLGHYVSAYVWCLIAFISSGFIFPMALLLQRPTASSILVKGSAVAGAGTVGFVNLLVGWGITIPAFHTDPQLVPLTLGIGLSLHFASIGWSFASRALVLHPVVRALVIVTLWYALPQARFTAIPLAIAIIYAVTVLLVRREVVALREAASPSIERKA